MREIEWGRNAWHRGLAGVKSGAQMRSREIRPGPRRGRRVSDAESPAPARPRSRRLAAGGQSFSSVTIVWSESRACTTSSFASSRYLRTCSFPPPGLYSPNDDVYASCEGGEGKAGQAGRRRAARATARERLGGAQ